MKTKIISVPIFLLITIGFLTNCSLLDSEYQVKVPEKGENSIVFYIDGKKYVSVTTLSLYGKTSPTYPLRGTYDVIKNSFYLGIFSESFALDFYIKDVIKTGTYYLNTPRSFEYYGFDTTINNCIFKLNTYPYYSFGPPPSGKINITELSEDKMIIKGTFEMKVFDLSLMREYEKDKEIYIINKLDSIVIKKGKFDINRKTLRKY